MVFGCTWCDFSEEQNKLGITWSVIAQLGIIHGESVCLLFLTLCSKISKFWVFYCFTFQGRVSIVSHFNSFPTAILTKSFSCIKYVNDFKHPAPSVNSVYLFNVVPFSCCFLHSWAAQKLEWMTAEVQTLFILFTARKSLINYWDALRW